MSTATPSDRARRRHPALPVALALAGALAAAEAATANPAPRESFSAPCQAGEMLIGFGLSRDAHVISMRGYCIEVTSQGAYDSDVYHVRGAAGGRGGRGEAVDCTDGDGVVRAVNVFEDADVPYSGGAATAVTRVTVLCIDSQNREFSAGAPPAPGSYTSQQTLSCPAGQRATGFSGGFGSPNPNLDPQLEVIRRFELQCGPLPAAVQPPPPPPGEAVIESVRLPVDVYDAPGDNPNRRVIGQLRAGDFVTLPQNCRADHWCRVEGQAVPGGGGWVWSGPGYDALARFAD